MCESCKQVLASERIELGQGGPPFHVCPGCSPAGPRVRDLIRG